MGRVGSGAAIARVRRPRMVVGAVAALRASESGLARLWDEGMARRRASSGTAAGTARLEAELGYGFGMWEGTGTPHAGFGYEEAGATAWGRASPSGRTSPSASRPNARKAPPPPSAVPVSNCG